MIKAHEKQLDLRLPRIGVIRKGGEMTRGAKASDTRPGRDLEYFRLDRAETAVVGAWHEALGDQPKAISGILPYADPAECLSIWDELWNGKRLMWRGDGERLHVKLDGDAYVRYAPGEGPAQPMQAGAKVGKDKVTRNSRLRLLLPQLRIAGIFEVMSSSSIDADELWANLMWIKSTVATLQGAPVTVFRSGRQFNIPNPKGEGMMAVTKHMLHLMLDGRYLDALLPSPVAGMLAPVQAAPALTAGDIVDDAPDVDDGEYEDAPPVNPVAAFVRRVETMPGPQAVGFVNGRLTDWINYVTDNRYDPAHDTLLVTVLNDYCSAVADNDNTHSKATAESARAVYRENIAAAGVAQDGLFTDAEDGAPVAAGAFEEN